MGRGRDLGRDLGLVDDAGAVRYHAMQEGLVMEG
jgi:hypothetical protein